MYKKKTVSKKRSFITIEIRAVDDVVVPCIHILLFHVNAERRLMTLFISRPCYTIIIMIRRA